MSQVDQVTERSATAAEQLASTAEEMTAQAHALRDLVSAFHKGAPAERSIKQSGAQYARAASPSEPTASSGVGDPEFRPF
jgi:methyl-accepting chemotaxis protein